MTQEPTALTGTVCKYKSSQSAGGWAWGIFASRTNSRNGQTPKGCVACEQQGVVPREAVAAACQVHAQREKQQRRMWDPRFQAAWAGTSIRRVIVLYHFSRTASAPEEQEAVRPELFMELVKRTVMKRGFSQVPFTKLSNKSLMNTFAQ